jgi:hypothetical protein
MSDEQVVEEVKKPRGRQPRAEVLQPVVDKIAKALDMNLKNLYEYFHVEQIGMFRDASDGGKFKFFTGLSGAVEPTTFVNDAGSGYTVATVVAKIDGGTF